MNYTYGACKTKGCEHTAPADTKLCRYCRGRVEDAAIVRERKRKGLELRPLLRCFMVAVKKSRLPVKNFKKVKLVPVAPHDVKIGQTISQHGKVISAENPHVGHGLYVKGMGKKKEFRNTPRTGYKLHLAPLQGVLFKTDQGTAFYTDDATVWLVR